MGNKHVKELKRLEEKEAAQMQPSGQGVQGIQSMNISDNSQLFCTDDAMCQNMVLSAGAIGSAPVYACPGAKCVGGSCQCGPGCTKDPRTGICCTSVDQIGGEYFCKETRA